MNHSTNNKTMDNSNITYRRVADITLGTAEAIALSELVFIFLLGTVGNSLVIFVFGWRKRNNRKHFEHLLLLLAITDLFVSIIIPLLFIYGTVTQYKQWHFGYVGCKMILSIFPITVTISQSILVLISFERYKSITDPLGARITKTFVYLWLLITLITACFLVSPYAYTLQVVTDKVYAINTCVPSNSINLFIYSLGNFIRDFAASVVMIVLGIMTSKSLTIGNLLLHKQEIKKHLMNANKARKLLIAVVCVFSCCVLPLDLFQFIIYTMYELKIQFTRQGYDIIIKCNTFLSILQVMNSAANIVIYSKMHQDFTRNIFACFRKSNDMIRLTLPRVRKISTMRSSIKRRTSCGRCLFHRTIYNNNNEVDI